MKTILKFTAMVIVVTVSFIIVSALIPYSEGLTTAHQDTDASAILFILISNAWLCLAIWYVTVNSPWEKSKLAFSLIGVLFLVASFMTQIETLFFRTAFPVLTTADIFWIFIANGVPIFVGVPLALYLFRNNSREQPDGRAIPMPSFRNLAAKLILIGIAYVFVYFLFGYFIAWQVEDLRVFYSGNPTDPGFFSQQMSNLEEFPIIYPFQFVRGVLFGVFVLPLLFMFKTNNRALFISMMLVFLSTAIPLVIPNPLFPESVRWAHFLEMITSMFFFSIIVWYVYTKVNIFPTEKRYKTESTVEGYNS